MNLKRFFTGFTGLVMSVSTVAIADTIRLENGTSDFCAGAQQILAQTGAVARVVTHSDYEAFVKSKPTASPLTVQQYSSTHLQGDNVMATVVSCKMKTAERINTAHAAAGGEAPIAGEDQSCELLHQKMLTGLLEKIPAQELAISTDKLVVDDEELTYIGPMWLKPWPFQPLSRDEAGRLHIHSRALYVPFSWWIPMPDRFKGTYYCHLIAPGYLDAVLRGNVQPGV